MRFKSAIIKDFKRFTHLTVQGIPETARLIMLAGPNGSGKSSFLDALSSWHKLSTRGNSWNDDYHLKVYSQKTPQWNQEQITVTLTIPCQSIRRRERNSSIRDPHLETIQIFKLNDFNEFQTPLMNLVSIV